MSIFIHIDHSTTRSPPCRTLPSPGALPIPSPTQRGACCHGRRADGSRRARGCTKGTCGRQDSPTRCPREVRGGEARVALLRVRCRLRCARRDPRRARRRKGVPSPVRSWADWRATASAAAPAGRRRRCSARSAVAWPAMRSRRRCTASTVWTTTVVFKDGAVRSYERDSGPTVEPGDIVVIADHQPARVER